MQKNNKTLIFKILSSSLSIISIFLLLEIYVRIIIDDGLNTNIEMLKYANLFKIVSENKSIGLEHRKNVKKKLMNVDLQLNSQGFRNNIDIDNKKKKILMLGDSMTLGWGANQTFSSILEKNINNNIQVLNAGIGNTNTYMQINNFFTNFIKYDFENVKIKKVSFFKKSLKEITKLKDYCKKNNILFVINNIPELRNLKEYKFKPETKIIENFSEVNGIKFIDSFEILKNYQEETLWVTKYDSHANDKAHLLIAEFLEKKLFNELNSFY